MYAPYMTCVIKEPPRRDQRMIHLHREIIVDCTLNDIYFLLWINEIKGFYRNENSIRNAESVNVNGICVG